jgi:hypothetical protein
LAILSPSRFDTTAIPIACQGLLIEEVGEDVVVYEPATKVAHALNAAAAAVLLSCDGKTSVAGIVRELLESGAEPNQQELASSVSRILEEFAQEGLVSISVGPGQ